MKLNIILFVALFALISFVAADAKTIGGKRPLNDDEIKEHAKTLSKSLTKVAAGDGPSYSLSKIFSGTTQTVAGTSTVVIAELIDNKTGAKVICELSLLVQPWLKENGYELSFNCDENTESSYRFSL